MHIYTYEEIQAGRYPTLESFQQVIELIHHQVPTNPALIGVTFGGSVAKGSYTQLSDIDGVGLYDSKKETEAFKAIQDIVDQAVELHVPVGDLSFVRYQLPKAAFTRSPSVASATYVIVLVTTKTLEITTSWICSILIPSLKQTALTAIL